MMALVITLDKHLCAQCQCPCIKPSALSVRGLQLLVYEALNY
jgi:hypothetical protein